MYEEFKEKIFPEILRSVAKERTLKVWLTGTGTGEDAYSIALVLYDYLKSQKDKRKFQVFANDAVLIGLIIDGFQRLNYPLKDLENIPQEYHKYLNINPRRFNC